MPQLIVCEKPKVAEKVADALAEGGVARKARHGVSYYEVERAGKTLFVAPAVGHIYTLREKKKSSGYPVFDIEWAPSWKVEKGARFTKSYLELLESLGKECDEFVNSCDFDLEGSLIGYNVIRFACKSKKGKRMKFSALTRDDLVEAYEGMTELDTNNALAGETRHILDWFWGINLSRALMHAIRNAGVYKVMSIGRVQGPALRILSLREEEILAFKPEPYWQLFAFSEGARFIHVKEKFFNRDEADAAHRNSEANRHNALVEKVSRTEKRIPPNPPFDLTSLQVEAFKCFGIAPASTLELAQTLYEASLISYPRTSSQKLPAKLNMGKVLRKLSENPDYAAKANALLDAGKMRPREGEKEDPAHPAIHPTGLAPGKQLGEREYKLYDLIAKRFLACFADYAVREGMRVDLGLGGEKYYSSGARTLAPGWLEFYAPYAKFEEETLPEFKEGMHARISKLSMDEKETLPPKRYTEASIIQALDKKNLGTKATRAVVIETLHKRGYTTGKRNLQVTPFGLTVHRSLTRHCPDILDEKMTREIEAHADAISEGKVDPDEVVREGRGVLERILDRFKKEEADIGSELAGKFVEQRREEETLGKCPACGKEMRILRSRKSGKQFVGCTGYPECTRTYPLPQMAKIIKAGKSCPSCGTPVIVVRRKARRDFEMCLDPNCATKANWGKKGGSADAAKANAAGEAGKKDEPAAQAEAGSG